MSRLLTALGTTLGHGRFQENNWRQDVLSRNSGKDMNPRLGQISRAADGRFVLVDSTISSVHHSLNSSSSDDGGFLPRRRPPRPGRVWVDRRSSWRRPLVTYPSELSLRSEGSGQSAISPSTIFTPIRHTAPPAPPRLLASSPTIPTTPASLLAAAWSPAYNFSDLSSVRQPSSADRSLPSASTFSPASYQPSYQQLRSIHEKYSQELPSLRAIHQDFALNKTRMPLVVPAVHPPLATSSPPRVRIGWGSRGGRSLVRHVRHARSAPELAASDADFLETSPSSSSGFGSKNTSQQNQSSHSGSTSVEWRLPPYRPPPPPPPISPPPPLAPLTALGHYNWLEFNTGLSCLPSLQPLKSTPDASVDGHYEFDSVLPPTPTGKSTSFEVDTCGLALYPSTSRIKPRLIHALPPSKYDNIEARVQAMKEEFHQFRKRQAQRRRSHELESAC